jgi:hypothetical protein
MGVLLSAYQPSQVDLISAWISTMFVLGIGLYRGARKCDGYRTDGQVCESMLSALVWLMVAIAAAYLLTWLFLFKLQIVSAFWLFWELPLLLSEIMVQRVLPIVALAAVIWSIIGRWKLHYRTRAVQLGIGCIAMLLADVLLLHLLFMTGPR